MAFVYTGQPDGTLSALEDDVLIVVGPQSDTSYAYEVWLGDEEPAYQGQAPTLNEAKTRVRAWLSEAHSADDE